MMSILICGSDPLLIGLRADVLKHRSFEAVAALGLLGLQQACIAAKPDAFLLCSSLRFTDRLHISKWVSDHYPFTPQLVLLREGEAAKGFRCSTLPIRSGPAAVVEAVSQLTLAA
jgi:hypothetical protein